MLCLHELTAVAALHSVHHAIEHDGYNFWPLIKQRVAPDD